MADYYPLIARAVAGLEKNNGENRRAIYERARTALLTQLRGLTPALNESDITRERLALEESIRKVEAESARKFMESARQPPPPRGRPIGHADAAEEPRSARSAIAQAAPVQKGPRQDAPAPLRRTSPPGATAASPPRMASITAKKPVPPRAQEPLSADFGPEAAFPGLPHPAADRPSGSEGDDRQSRRFGPGAVGLVQRAKVGAALPQGAAPAMRQPELDADQRWHERSNDHPAVDRAGAGLLGSHARQELMLDAQHDPHAEADFSEAMLEPPFAVADAASGGREGVVTSAAFPEDETFGRAERARWLTWRPSRGLVGKLAAVAAALALIATVASQWSNLTAFYHSLRGPAVETVRNAPSASARPKVSDRIEPGSQAAPALAGTSISAPAPAQKVVLYEEDPSDPNGKRFVGSAIWRTETVTAGPGQSPELAVRADVEVPERKLAMTWSLRRNTDKGLPASHTVEILFKLPADFPAGEISNVPGILMKAAEQTRGVPLSGLAVKVTNGYFLIGLSSVEADKERNLQLLKDRAWFDIPVVYSNNRRAILALEKGTPGERVFAEAFKVWKQ
jgi:hypothetical protein